MEPNKYAELLRQAAATKKAIPPLRDEIGIDDIDFAYSIQKVNTQYKVANGARIVGKKIGLTSFSVQKQLGIDQPDFGILFDYMEILNGQSISYSELMQPKAEAEIAFVLSQDIDSEKISIIDLINAIDYALPAIEIVGSRIQNWNIKITDTVADNAASSHFVVGHTYRKLNQIDLVNCKMRMTKNNELVSEGVGHNCLGSPLNAMLWLAKKMAVMGNPLRKGELILSGALGPMVEIKAGDQFNANFENLGSVSVSFD